jgi:hypothetical protein
MNRKDIEQWTREAGGFDATPKFLEDFAKLVAQHERNEIIQILEDSTGYVQMDLIRDRGQA